MCSLIIQSLTKKRYDLAKDKYQFPETRTLEEKLRNKAYNKYKAVKQTDGTENHLDGQRKKGL